MSQDRKPLQHNQLRHTVTPVTTETLSDRVRVRLREEMARQHLSQRDVANLLGWTQSRVSKTLNAYVELGVEEMGAMCFALGLHVTEVVRDHGLEFLAEMTPTELRILERIRQLPRPVLDAVMTVIDVHSTTRRQERRALPKKQQ